MKVTRVSLIDYHSWKGSKEEEILPWRFWKQVERLELLEG